MASLTGFENVAYIDGSLFIYNNSALASLTGLQGITSIGDLSIQYNDALTSLAGLENVTSIELHLYIIGNDALTSLTGLEGLTSIGGTVEIYKNRNPDKPGGIR